MAHEEQEREPNESFRQLEESCQKRLEKFDDLMARTLAKRKQSLAAVGAAVASD